MNLTSCFCAFSFVFQAEEQFLYSICEAHQGWVVNPCSTDNKSNWNTPSYFLNLSCFENCIRIFVALPSEYRKPYKCDWIWRQLLEQGFKWIAASCYSLFNVNKWIVDCGFVTLLKYILYIRTGSLYQYLAFIWTPINEIGKVFIRDWMRWLLAIYKENFDK